MNFIFFWKMSFLCSYYILLYILFWFIHKSMDLRDSFHWFSQIFSVSLECICLLYYICWGLGLFLVFSRSKEICLIWLYYGFSIELSPLLFVRCPAFLYPCFKRSLILWSKCVFVFEVIRAWFYFHILPYLPNPSAWAGYDTRSIF